MCSFLSRVCLALVGSSLKPYSHRSEWWSIRLCFLNWMDWDVDGKYLTADFSCGLMSLYRGFVLMSTHQEAVEAMRAMNGTWHAGFKMDVSWALIQREAKHFGSSSV